MTLLRLLLLFGLIYYGVKLLARLIFRSDSQRQRVKSDRRAAGGDQPYRDLTDQEIEDADFEEIEPGGE